MFYLKGMAAGAALALSLGAQELPAGFSLSPGEERYCSATFRDLEGKEFHGAVQAAAKDESTIVFTIVEKDPEYTAKNDEDAFRYGKKRAVINVVERKIDSMGDTMTIDGKSYFGAPELPAGLGIPEPGIKFASDVFGCYDRK